MKKLIFSMVFVFLVLQCYSQKYIKGVVYDDIGNALPNATISIEGSFTTSFADQNGNFSLEIPKGTTTFFAIASCTGYYSDTEFMDEEKYNIGFKFYLKVNLGSNNLSATIRATTISPFTSSNIFGKELKQINVGQDLPILLNNQPSVLTTSDAGAGIGYTGIRIRGSDATRINVSLNGIPVNDAESHGVFWVNMPDIANNVKSIQIQRGVGTSTNGSGAFGGAVNIVTDDEPTKANVEASVSGGSFSTKKISLKGTTGLLKNGFYFGGRTSIIRSNGYVDRAFSELNSYAINGGWIHKKTSIKFLRIWGQEYTYQSWYGTPESRVNNDKKGLIEHYNRNLGVLYNNSSDSSNLFNSNRKYNYYLYNNETDNYTQSHNQLQFVHQFLPQSSVYLTLNYTSGQGYFEQFRFKDNLATYGLTPVIVGSDTFIKSNLVRQRWLVNDFYAVAGGYNKQIKRVSFVIGGGYFYYDGFHFGNVKSTEYNVGANKVYYEAKGKKKDANLFVKVNFPIGKLLVFTDVQYRYINHVGSGKDNDQRIIVFRNNYRFFNPKIGATYPLSTSISVYSSVAIGQREPTRSDFTDRVSSVPVHEKLDDWEAGFNINRSKWNMKLNGYYMDYKNQLVLTGKLNDVGTGLRTNVIASYRAGLELVAEYQISKKWLLSGNANLSRNIIKNFNENIENYDSSRTEIIGRGNTPISYSPSWISALNIKYVFNENMNITLVHKIVSRQYLDNSGLIERSLAGYNTLDIRFYGSNLIKKLPALTVSFMANNVLNRMYSSNGYSYTYIYGTSITENYLYPQAGINFLAGITYSFSGKK